MAECESIRPIRQWRDKRESIQVPKQRHSHAKESNRRSSLLKPASLTDSMKHPGAGPRKEVRFKSPEILRLKKTRKRKVLSPKHSAPLETARDKRNPRFFRIKNKKEQKDVNRTRREGRKERKRNPAKLLLRKHEKETKKPETEHPLYSELKNATLAYETHLTIQGPKALEEAVKTVYTRLEAVDLTLSNMLETYKESVHPMERDFKDEKLHLTLDARTSKEKNTNVTIGERVAAFSAFIKAQKGKAQELIGQWEAMTEEFERLEAGFRPLGENVGGEATEGYTAQVKKLQEEYHTQREKIVKTFNEECTKLENKAGDSEKSYEATLAKQRNTLLQYLQLETEIRDADEDMDDEEDDDQGSEDGLDDEN